MFVVSFFLNYFALKITPTYNYIRYGVTSVHILNQPISDEPTNSVGIKTEYTQRGGYGNGG